MFLLIKGTVSRVFIFIFIKGTVRVIWKWPSMQRWQCLIHNGTLKTCIWSKMLKLKSIFWLEVTFTEKSIRLPSLHGGSLEITFTVPLITLSNQRKHSCVDVWILLFHWLITIPSLIQIDKMGKCPFWKYQLLHVKVLISNKIESSPPFDVEENHGTNGA